MDSNKAEIIEDWPLLNTAGMNLKIKHMQLHCGEENTFKYNFQIMVTNPCSSIKVFSYSYKQEE